MLSNWLVNCATSDNDFDRLDAAIGLKDADPSTIDLLRRLVADPNDFVRLKAKKSVSALAARTGDIPITTLGIQSARDNNLHVRIAAWNGLKTIPRDQLRKAFRPPKALPGYEADCLNRNLVPVLGGKIVCNVCIAFVATPGFEHLMDMCIESIERNGGLGHIDHTYVAFMPGANEACREVCLKHGAICVEPLSLIAPHASMKGMIHSIHRWVKANCYISIEPDMLVFSSIADIVDAVLASKTPVQHGVPSYHSIQDRRKAREVNAEWPPDLQTVIDRRFAGDGLDREFLLGDRSINVPSFCNAGLFAGNAEAFERVEAEILSMQPFAELWIDTAHIYWRDEMVWNMAYGLADNFGELPKMYNWEPTEQSPKDWTDPDTSRGLPFAIPEDVKIVHFIGELKHTMALYSAHGFAARKPGLRSAD